jgi:hypothetical protein
MMINEYFLLQKYIIFITVGINFLLLPSLVIKYIHSQLKDRLAPDSINESRFSDNDRYGSFNNSTKVSKVLTPDSINQNRSRQD